MTVLITVSAALFMYAAGSIILREHCNTCGIASPTPARTDGDSARLAKRRSAKAVNRLATVAKQPPSPRRRHRETTPVFRRRSAQIADLLLSQFLILILIRRAIRPHCGRPAPARRSDADRANPSPRRTRRCSHHTATTAHACSTPLSVIAPGHTAPMRSEYSPAHLSAGSR